MSIILEDDMLNKLKPAIKQRSKSFAIPEGFIEENQRSSSSNSPTEKDEVSK